MTFPNIFLSPFRLSVTGCTENQNSTILVVKSTENRP